jgi:hypothetical protein
MSRRPAQHTEEGARLLKFVAVAAILATLALFSSLSYSFSQDRARRIACVDNQRKMSEAVAAYQMDNAGVIPPTVWYVRRYYSGPLDRFKQCPVDPDLVYAYSPKSELVTCPNQAHRPH